jgi:hypothetical protein
MESVSPHIQPETTWREEKQIIKNKVKISPAVVGVAIFLAVILFLAGTTVAILAADAKDEPWALEPATIIYYKIPLLRQISGQKYCTDGLVGKVKKGESFEAVGLECTKCTCGDDLQIVCRKDYDSCDSETSDILESE